jgi:hypothetical protein
VSRRDARVSRRGFGASGRWLWLGAAFAAIALSGCESNVERSAQLERVRLRHNAALKASVLSISKPNPQVAVLGSTILEGKEGDAVAVSLRNRSAKALADLPIEIEVKDAAGELLYRNNVPGVAGSLVTVPLLRPGASTTWIDDQVSATDKPASVSVLVGQGSAATGPVPQIRIEGRHATEGGEGVAGTVLNRSRIAQRELVVNAVASRAGKIVAAGRAVLPEVAAGSSTVFQLYLIGDPRGASLHLSAPATSLR